MITFDLPHVNRLHFCKFVKMGKLKIYDTSLSRDQVIAEREYHYLSSSPKEKLERLFLLIRISITLNNGKPLKIPQGKGLIIYRKKN